MEKPTSDGILGNRASLQESWSNAHHNWEDTENFLEKKHQIMHNGALGPWKLATSRSKVFAMADTLVTSSPTVVREPRKEGNAHEERNTRVTLWAESLLAQASVMGQVMPPFRAAGVNLSTYGYAAMVTRWDDTIWPHALEKGATKEEEAEYELKRSRAFPFIIEAPHPGRILLPPMERRPSVAIESLTMYGWQLRGMNEAIAKNVHGDDFQIHEVVLYTNDEWEAMVINNEIADVRENTLGIIPYTHAFAGLGYEHSPMYAVGGSTTSTLGPLPEHLAVGIIDAVKGSLVVQDEMHTAIRAMMMRMSAAHIFYSGDVDEMAENLKIAGLGGVIPKDFNAELAWEQFPQMNDAMFNVLDMARRDIDEATFATVVQGIRSPGVDTASQHAMQLSAARQKFGIPMLQLATMGADTLGFCSRMVEDKDVSITIGGHTVKGADFEKDYHYVVDFLAQDEASQLRNQEIGARLVQQGLKSKETFHQEDTNMRDHPAEQRRITTEQIMASPQINDQIIQAALAGFNNRLAAEGQPVPPPQAPQGQQGPPQMGPSPNGAINQPGGVNELQQSLAQQVAIPGNDIVRSPEGL